MWQGYTEHTARGPRILVSLAQQAEAELELRAKERSQGRECSVQQMLTELVPPALLLHAVFPRSDALLHSHMPLLVEKYHPFC